MSQPSLAAFEERLAASKVEIEALTQETLNLYRQVNLLYRIGESMNACLSPEDVGQLVLRESCKILRATSGRIVLDDGVTLGTRPEVVESELQVPIENAHGHLGVVTIFNKRNGFFTAADEKLIRAVARQAGIALENNRLIQGLLAKNRELERLNEELKAVDQMKSDFVSNVSHELRTPLASIKGFAATILADDEMPPEIQREFVGIINDESDKLSVIINDILDISKMMSGHMKFDVRPAPLESVVYDVVKLLNMLAERKGLALTFDLIDPAMILMDSTRISQVLKNLVGNAIKFTDTGGVRLTQWLEGDHVCLAVEDTGEGIPEDHLPYIFEKFYRVENVVHTKEGTGLGLALVRTIVDHHHGTIDVRSRPGEGSTFTVRLPLALPPGDAEVSRAEAHPDR
ncbi:ATP-binding protein [Myxococcota bacterium]|nr:ATP-binding protein [Myxococcota bacterium]